MRFSSSRYGNPVEFEHYIQGLPLPLVARRLRRSERCIRNYLSRAEKLPWWIPELLRLQNLEHWQRMRQMNMVPRPGVVQANGSATIYTFPGPTVAPTVEPEHFQDEHTLPLFAEA